MTDASTLFFCSSGAQVAINKMQKCDWEMKWVRMGSIEQWCRCVTHFIKTTSTFQLDLPTLWTEPSEFAFTLHSSHRFHQILYSFSCVYCMDSQSNAYNGWNDSCSRSFSRSLSKWFEFYRKCRYGFNGRFLFVGICVANGIAFCIVKYYYFVVHTFASHSLTHSSNTHLQFKYCTLVMNPYEELKSRSQLKSTN